MDIFKGKVKQVRILETFETSLEAMHAHAQWLQNEWNAAKQRVEELNQRTGRLEGELDLERQRTVQLEAELQAALEQEKRTQARAQWLQNEWDAAKRVNPKVS